MKIKMVTNLGLQDAARLGIEAFLDTEEFDADKKVAESLIRSGWAIPVEDERHPAPAAKSVYEPPHTSKSGGHQR